MDKKLEKTKIHKEVVIEEKLVTVPVKREELVIENMNGTKETIRIPISEERIEIVKHPVVLNDISVYRHQFQEIRHIEEMLKEEKLKVQVYGDIQVTEQ